MFLFILLQIYNATICEIIMQASLNSVYSKLYNPPPFWGSKSGSKLNIDIHAYR